jgi:hypothetical protein
MIQLTDNLEINKPAPVDDRLGVFESTAEALAYTNEDRRYIGLTVIVDDGTGAVEYWFKDGVTDSDLEVKSTGGVGASWGSITGTLSNQTDLQTALNAKANTSSLATVATSGNYNDLTNKPTIPNAQVNSDWNATSGVAEILNKPTIPSITGLVPYTGATDDVDLGTHDLYTNKLWLFDEPNGNHASLHYTDDDFHIEHANGDKMFVIEDGFIQLHKTNNIQSNLFTTNLTETRDHYLPNQSGTIALTSDITKGAVGLGNVDNTSDANKPISTATQTALDRITGLFQNVSQLSTTSTTAVTLTTFTVASANIPVGGVIRISGLIERTAGASGNTTVGINVNSGGARYLQSAGTNSQFEMLICKTTSTNVRYGLGASNTTGNSFTGHNSVSISVAQDGSGNFNIALLGFVGTASTTLTVQFVKGNLL